MLKTNLPLFVIIIIGILAVATIVVVVLLYSGDINNNPYPTPSQIATPTPTAKPTTTITSIPTSTPTATPNSRFTVTYSEISRNQTMIVIQFKLEPNSYIFQVNATSFYLFENGNKISSSLNDVVIIGTQYSTLYFPINNYNGINYTMTSDALPPYTLWIKQS